MFRKYIFRHMKTKSKCKHLYFFNILCQYEHYGHNHVNPIPTGQGRNQPLYERHVTKSGRNRVKYLICTRSNKKNTTYISIPLIFHLFNKFKRKFLSTRLFGLLNLEAKLIVLLYKS